MSYGVVAKRSAVSTVIGMLFFIVIMGAAFAAFLTFMNVNSEFLNSQLQLSQQEVGRIQEKFGVLAIDDGTGSNLRVDVENKGDGPLEVADLWIINKTASVCPPCESKLIEIEYADSFVSPKDTVNILANTPLSLSPGLYDLKVVSSLGNVETLSFEVGSSALFASLTTNPSLVANAANTTLILNVLNNSSKTFYDVIPTKPTVTPPEALDGGGVVNGSQHSVDQLDPGESFTFTWNYELRGATGTSVKFVTNATAKSNIDSSRDIISNNATAIIELTPEIPKQQDTAIKPEVLVVFPSPAGEARNKNAFNLWGVILTNPTDQFLAVYRVQIAVKSAVSGDHKIIMQTDAQGTAGSQNLVHVLPCCVDGVDEINNVDYRDGNGVPREPPQSGVWGPDGCEDPIGRWTVPENNLLVWTRHSSQEVIIPPLGVQEFIAKIPTGGIPDSNSLLITANAYTSFGQFSNIGNTFRVNGTERFASIVNAYPTSKDVTGFGDEDAGLTVENGVCKYPDRDFQGSITTTAGQTTQFYVTVREGQFANPSDVTVEESGMIRGITEALGASCADNLSSLHFESNLTISFPSGFSGITAFSNPDFCDATLKTFDDGSKQLVVPIATDIGNVAASTDRKTFQFSVVAPDVKKTTHYVIRMGVTGVDRWYNQLGPVTEMVLIVKPAS